MLESGVRFFIGCILHGDQFDGSFSDQDESEAETHELHQCFRFLHSRHPAGTVPGRRPFSLDLTVQMHRRRPEAYV